MMSEYFYIPPNVQATLAVIKEQQEKYNSLLKPVREQQAKVNDILERTNYYETLERINSMIAPAIETADQYKAIIDSITNNLPNLTNASDNLLSEVESNISRAISMDSFPYEIPSFKINNQDFYNDVQKSVSTEIIFNVHEEYQKTSENKIDKGNKTDEKDEIIKHSTLRSDLSSKEWHARIWVEAIYKFIVGRLIIFSAGTISEMDLRIILKTVIELIDRFKQ